MLGGRNTILRTGLSALIRKKLLIVDDNGSFAESLADVLSQQGFEVRWAAQAAKARTLARDFRPDVLIVDEILAVMRRKRIKVHVPAGLARVPATILEVVCGRLLRRPPPLNRDQIVMLEEDNIGDSKPANDLFALKPHSFRDGIARYL